MAGYSEAALKRAVDAVAAGYTFISFHTADSATGANEVAGTETTRPQTTWGAAGTGAASGDRVGTEVSQSIGAGVAVSHWGLWSTNGATVGEFGGMFPLLAADGVTPVTETFTNAGTIRHTPTLDFDNV